MMSQDVTQCLCNDVSRCNAVLVLNIDARLSKNYNMECVDRRTDRRDSPNAFHANRQNIKL
jgi:hypothetical protein